MKTGLVVGLTHNQPLKIDARLTVPFVSSHFSSFATMPEVFATAFMVGFVEWACVELIKPYYEETEDSVGTHINMSHEAATPVGDTVSALVKLEKIEGRKLHFSFVCTDSAGDIGRGTHERVMIHRPKFDAKLAEKRAKLAG
jgi:fluoroacetyl-CoA thioesterase